MGLIGMKGLPTAVLDRVCAWICSTGRAEVGVDSACRLLAEGIVEFPIVLLYVPLLPGVVAQVPVLLLPLAVEIPIGLSGGK